MIVDSQLVPRFVHCVDVWKDISITKSSGMTIAYIRYDDMVLFGYTLCSKNDQYRKSTGRELALKALDKSSDITTDCFLAPKKMIDMKTCTGFVDISVFKDFANSENAFSDQLMDAVGMFDFKHAFISSVLATVIEQFLFDENW